MYSTLLFRTTIGPQQSLKLYNIKKANRQKVKDSGKQSLVKCVTDDIVITNQN